MICGLPALGSSVTIGPTSPRELDKDPTADKNPPKQKFLPSEDQKLQALVMRFGSKDWPNIAKMMETRNPRQCRERWCNYLDPNLRNDPYTPAEDSELELRFKEFGPRWNKIAKFFTRRSDNSLRNRWMMIERHKLKASSPESKEAPDAAKKPTCQKRREKLRGKKDLAKEQTLNPFELFEPEFGTADIFDVNDAEKWPELSIFP